MYEDDNEEIEEAPGKYKAYGLNKKQVSLLLSRVNELIDPPIDGHDKDKMEKLADVYYYLDSKDLTPTSRRQLEHIRQIVRKTKQNTESSFFVSATDKKGAMPASRSRRILLMEILNSTKNKPKTSSEILRIMRDNMPMIGTTTPERYMIVVAFLFDVGLLEKEPITKKLKTKFTFPYEGVGD